MARIEDLGINPINNGDFPYRLEQSGLVYQLSSGIFLQSPYYKKAIDKLTETLKIRLQNQGFLEIGIPPLSPKQLWVESGRYERLLQYTNRR